jgi:putative endonuclease
MTNLAIAWQNRASCPVYRTYIMASASGVLYTGVTKHLERRVTDHKQKLRDSFTKKYDVTCLVYYEPFDHVKSAISREKQIKSWREEISPNPRQESPIPRPQRRLSPLTFQLFVSLPRSMEHGNTSTRGTSFKFWAISRKQSYP